MGELLDTTLWPEDIFNSKDTIDTFQKELLDTNDTIDTNVGVKKVNISGDQKSRILRPIVNTKRKFSNRIVDQKRAPLNTRKGIVHKIVDQKRRILRPIVNTKRKFSNKIVDKKRRILGPIIRPLIDLKQKKLGFLKSLLIKKKLFGWTFWLIFTDFSNILCVYP